LEKFSPDCQGNFPQLRIAASSSRTRSFFVRMDNENPSNRRDVRQQSRAFARRDPPQQDNPNSILLC
jgi:hypothetical protein